MNTPTYKYKNVEYGYSKIGRTWRFKAPNYELLQRGVKGNETAHRIARIFEGALQRTGGEIDGLARHHISKLVSI